MSRAASEPAIQEKILMGPVGEVSPIRSAMNLNISTITKNTTKTTKKFLISLNSCYQTQELSLNILPNARLLQFHLQNTLLIGRNVTLSNWVLQPGLALFLEAACNFQIMFVAHWECIMLLIDD
jgi:hypothetical protein